MIVQRQALSGTSYSLSRYHVGGVVRRNSSFKDKSYLLVTAWAVKLSSKQFISVICVAGEFYLYFFFLSSCTFAGIRDLCVKKDLF